MRRARNRMVTGQTGVCHGTRSSLADGRTWRWRRDSNPGWTCAHTRFRGALLRPLGHATADEGTRAADLGRNPSSRRARPSGRQPTPTHAHPLGRAGHRSLAGAERRRHPAREPSPRRSSPCASTQRTAGGDGGPHSSTADPTRRRRPHSATATPRDDFGREMLSAPYAVLHHSTQCTLAPASEATAHCPRIRSSGHCPRIRSSGHCPNIGSRSPLLHRPRQSLPAPASEATARCPNIGSSSPLRRDAKQRVVASRCGAEGCCVGMRSTA